MINGTFKKKYHLIIIWNVHKQRIVLIIIIWR